jgi:EpsI family protein
MRLQAAIAALIMMLAAAMAYAMKPRDFLADKRPPFTLEKMLPESFDGWTVDRNVVSTIITGAQVDLMRTIYHDILSRTYVNAAGERVMLAVTYGKDQRADGAVHYPEVCYPAQGFRVLSNRLDSVMVAGQRQQVRRLQTSLNDRRMEPVTYWTTIGDYSSLDSFEKRLIEMRYGVRGVVPDGVLFRVSSIGPNSEREFELQARFIDSILRAVRPEERRFLSGAAPH